MKCLINKRKKCDELSHFLYPYVFTQLFVEKNAERTLDNIGHNER